MTIRSEDEMSFNFLKSQYGYIDTYQWNTTNIAGDSLYPATLCPAMMKYTDTRVYNAKTAVFGVGPPAYYLSKCFSLWRGAIKVRITFAKTDFHTGRVMITWTPGTGGFTSPTVSSSTYSMREIVDLSNSSCIELELPYLVADNYLPVATPSGLLSVRVLNPLRAPATCETAIKFVIEVAGGSDFELQVPTSTVSLLPFYPQMESVMTGEVKKVEAGELNASSALSVEKSRYCIGEHFTSLKQLLSRNSVNNNSVVVAGSNHIGVQQLANQLNNILGTYGTTIDLANSINLHQSEDAKALKLAADVAAGKGPEVLIMMGVNPVYSLPNGAEFAKGLKSIKTVGENIKKYAPNAFVIVITNPLDAMVYVMRIS